MRFLTRSLTGLFLLALTLGLLGAGVFTLTSAIEAKRSAAPRAPLARERVFAANVIPVEFTTLAPVMTAYGEIRATRQLELRAAAAGTVVRLDPAFEEGAGVAQGTLLVQLDPTEAQAARDSAAASKAEAEAALAQAERALLLAGDDLAAAQKQAGLRARALDRQVALGAKGIGSAAAVEEAELANSSAEQAVLSKRAALSSAQAQRDQARTALDRATIALGEADRKLADTAIRAEFAGRLANVTAVQGGLVSGNEKLGDLIDPTALEVAFRVSTEQFRRLTDDMGQPLSLSVALHLGAQDAAVARAQLVRVSAAVEEGATGRLLFAGVTEGAGALRPGDFVTVKLTEPALEQVARIPASAVDASGAVLRLGDGDRLEEVAVTVLRRQGDTVIIRAGALEQGAEIVAERTPLLGRGIKLRPLRPGQGDAAAAGAAPAPAPETTVRLDPERRARLLAFVEANSRMPADAKARIAAQLQEDEVPASVIERLESRMGG